MAETESAIPKHVNVRRSLLWPTSTRLTAYFVLPMFAYVRYDPRHMLG